MTKVDALKKMLVAFGYGSNVSDYSGITIATVLKEFAVKAECATKTDDIKTYDIVGIMNYITANKGSEEHEPFDLEVTETNTTVTVKQKNKVITPGDDVLYKGNMTVTAAPDEGYELDTLTVNETAIESGDKVTVNGNVEIVATATLKTFDLARTATECTISVTKGEEAVLDGEGALSYGDEITITATAGEGKEMKTLTVNGEAFTSGETLTVDGDITIVGTAE